MSNIQIHLVFRKPRFFTKGPILDQLRDFAKLGFSKALQNLLLNNSDKNFPSFRFKGENYLAFLSQLITELETLETMKEIDTQAARHQYSLFDHYWNNRKGYKQEIQMQLGDQFKPLQEGELHQEGLLLQNIAIRAQLFKEKIIALRDERLLAQAMHYAEKAGKIYQTAFLHLIAIDKIKDQALEKKEPVEEDMKSIMEYMGKINALTPFFDKLGLQKALDTCHDPKTNNDILKLAKEIELEKSKVLATYELAQQALLKVKEHNQSLQKKDTVVEEKAVTLPEEIIPESALPPVTDNKTTHTTETEIPKETVTVIIAPTSEPNDATALKQKEAIENQLGILITLAQNYKALLESEKNDYVTRFFHQSRKENKISYCTHLLAQLQKTEVTADSSLKGLVNKAHEVAKKNAGSSQRLTAGGSYLGTSRMLAMQRLLGIDEAWAQGQSSFIGINMGSDFHGLKAIGIVEKVKAIVSRFFSGDANDTENNSQFKELCERVAPSQLTTKNKQAAQ